MDGQRREEAPPETGAVGRALTRKIWPWSAGSSGPADALHGDHVFLDHVDDPEPPRDHSTRTACGAVRPWPPHARPLRAARPHHVDCPSPGRHLPWAVTDGQSEVLLVGGQALADRVRAAYLLQAGRDLGVAQVRVVATLAADELEPAAFHPAVHHLDRLAAQYRGAAVTRLASLRRGMETWATGPQPRITRVVRAVRCGDGVHALRQRCAVGGTGRCGRHRTPRSVVRYRRGPERRLGLGFKNLAGQ